MLTHENVDRERVASVLFLDLQQQLSLTSLWMLRCQRVAPRASVRALQRIALPPPRPPTLRFRSYSSTPSSEAPKPTPSAASSPLASKPKPGEGAPFRYPLAWQDPEFYDEKKLEEVRLMLSR